TFGSLRNNTVEEVFELSEAIAEGNLEQVKKELGDVLLSLVDFIQGGAAQPWWAFTAERKARWPGL
ncbi:MAG: MazG nucleotide pyrophosphohydrolase domain-containing protein, partial [Cardiobacterium sp.]